MDAKITFVGDQNTSNLTSLGRVIQHKLNIPSYQRPYAWNDENIEDLFNTIQSSSSAASSDESVFFGSIILSKEIKNNTEIYKIIDGQQRITTFLLVLRVLVDTLKSEAKRIESVLNTLEDQDEKIMSNTTDRKTHKELQDQIFVQKQDADKCKNLIEKINKILEVRISREKYTFFGLNNKEEDDLEYISFVSTGKIGASSDFKKSKRRIEEKIKKMANEAEEQLNQKGSSKDYEKYEAVAKFILDKVKFCLLEVSGPDSEAYSIDIFNTLNSTGEALTGFEVLKSKMEQCYANEKSSVQECFEGVEKSIKNIKSKRKDLIAQTGNLILYMCLYRNDYGSIKLSDKDFKAQNEYIKQLIDNNKTSQSILYDLKNINNFAVDNWLKGEKQREYRTTKQISNMAIKSFDFLKDINHDKVLPILYRWSRHNLEDRFEADQYSKIIEICTGFSLLWRMAYDGGARGIPVAYETIAKEIAQGCSIKNKVMPVSSAASIFKDKLMSQFKTSNKWMDKAVTSSLSGKKITKFLLAIDSLVNFENYNSSDWKLIQVSNIRDNSIGNELLVPQIDYNKCAGEARHIIKNLYKSLYKNHVHQKFDLLNMTEDKVKKRANFLANRIWEKWAQNLGLKG